MPIFEGLLQFKPTWGHGYQPLDCSHILDPLRLHHQQLLSFNQIPLSSVGPSDIVSLNVPLSMHFDYQFPSLRPPVNRSRMPWWCWFCALESDNGKKPTRRIFDEINEAEASVRAPFFARRRRRRRSEHVSKLFALLLLLQPLRER